MTPTVLIVDDNDEILEFLTTVLENNYGLLRAYDGNEALNTLNSKDVDLVISDVMMPGMDGFELCRIIKSTAEYSHIPVILLTAKNTIQSKIEGLELGADVYIEKPFATKYLLAQISSIIENRNKIKTYFATSPMAHMRSTAHSKADKDFLERLHEQILAHIEDPELDVEKISKLMIMSRVTLYRKIKSITGVSPIELINITRVKKSAELLSEGSYKIYEVSEMVGFGSTNSFSRNFYKHFGITPSDFVIKQSAEKK